MEYTDYKSEEMTESVRPEEKSLFNDIQKEQMSKACNYLYSISKWMKFFFVLTLISIVFMFVLGLIFLIAGPVFDQMNTTGITSGPAFCWSPVPRGGRPLRANGHLHQAHLHGGGNRCALQ